MNISAEQARTITAQNTTIEALIRKAAAKGETQIVVPALRKEQWEEFTQLGFRVRTIDRFNRVEIVWSLL